MPGTASITATVQDAHPVWGRCVFLEGSGDPEAIRDEYARLAPAWPPLHFAVVAGPTPEALDPWYRLGFAQMHAYGTRASGSEPVEAPGVSIRRGGLDDVDLAQRIDRLIHEAQAAPPSYSSFEPDELQHRRDWEEGLADQTTYYVVAERDGEPVGHATVYPDPTDEAAMHLASTAVVPAARGSGVGVALTAHALAFTAAQGRPRLRTNWRVTNLAASRFWPARGFELTHLRLVRRLPDL